MVVQQATGWPQLGTCACMPRLRSAPCSLVVPAPLGCATGTAGAAAHVGSAISQAAWMKMPRGARLLQPGVGAHGVGA